MSVQMVISFSSSYIEKVKGIFSAFPQGTYDWVHLKGREITTLRVSLPKENIRVIIRSISSIRGVDYDIIPGDKK